MSIKIRTGKRNRKKKDRIPFGHPVFLSTHRLALGGSCDDGGSGSPSDADKTRARRRPQRGKALGRVRYAGVKAVHDGFRAVLENARARL
ncbi:MAG: hypothetical protein LBE50_03815 [Gallionellaceae bacterium]|nr:hypothetical protein [Gallionellaceae bacterium]